MLFNRILCQQQYLEDDELCDHNMTNINLFDNVIEYDYSVNHDNIVLNDRVNIDLVITNASMMPQNCLLLYRDIPTDDRR